jgi:L-ascorbate metabolism protein UlaG (beta-lactamase superfamily)
MRIKLTLLIMSITFFACKASSGKSGDDTFMTVHHKSVTIHFIKHSSLMITYNGCNIEVDPVTALPPQTDYSQYPKADYIFVTHEHSDHFDKQAITTLSKPGTEIITNTACAEKLGRGKALSNGDSLTLANGIKALAVPAYNTTPKDLQFHPKGRDNGFVLMIDGLRIYIAGDTEYIPEMAQLKNIDIAFLPCNQPYTMTIEQLVRAAKIIRPKVLYPYHYNETNVGSIIGLLKGSGIEVRIKEMK